MKPYDLLIIGGGTAGLVAAVGAAGQGARTLLVERDRTGGDCLWTGCVPSKALLTVAEHAHIARSSGELGVHAGEVSVDFTAAMAHVKASIATIEPHDSPDRLRSEGIEVRTGTARFVGPQTVEVDGDRIRFRHAMIATGATPVIPPLPGLADVDALTSETLWDLTDLPGRLVVLGGGPIGSELGQAFGRLGSDVTIVEMAPTIIPREEPEAAAVLTAQLTAEGVQVLASTTARRVETDEDGTTHLVVSPSDADDGVAERAIPFDQILVAVGRKPSTGDLGLDVAGVELTDRGAIAVDGRLRTSNPRIFAGGDATMLLPFTHVASTHGATVVQNALFGLRASVDHQRIPWVTFTDPEVARIGLSAAEARERFGDDIAVRTSPHGKLDRAVTSGRTEGFAQLVGDDKGRIVGATIVGPRAGEGIGEVAAWMANGAKLGRITRTTHAYPTWSADLADASLQELRVGLERLKPATRILLWARRLLRR